MNLEHELNRLVDQINERNDRTNLFYRDQDGSFSCPFPQELERFLGENLEAVRNDLLSEPAAMPERIRRLADYAASRACRTITDLNQYVHPDSRLRNDLFLRYRDFIGRMFDAVLKVLDPDDTEWPADDEWLREIVQSHQDEFRRIVAGIDELKHVPADQPTLDRVPCDEYEARLQLEALGIDPDRLLEPVLDVGCGGEAHLVHALRAHGIEAFGLDRNVHPTEFLTRADWLEVEYGESQWGTVISHLSFANHFLRQNLKKEGTWAEYGRAYMEILASLLPGGSFVYVPGLPFIETHLPVHRYTVHRKSVINGISAVRITRRADDDEQWPDDDDTNDSR